VTNADAEPAWVRQAQAGSASAFGRLVQAHQQGLRAFLWRLTGNPSDAEDVAQDSFVFAWEHIGRFDAGRPFRPWLYGIGWRKFRQGKRSWLRMLARESRAAEAAETVIHADPGLRLDLAMALNTLPAEQRAALLLCLLAEFSHAEAAEALALPLGTIKSHVARGREKLATALGGRDG
jgi:RNA polymerase sigma-70 factor (ECF subfamily)